MNPVDNPTLAPRTTAPGAILARVGHACHCLALHLPNGGGRPALVDATGARVNPWEVELLRWPPEAEAPLWRGGYLPVRPTDMELWCNCVD